MASTDDEKHGVSASTVRNAVLQCLKRIRVEPDKYSPVSMRKGGVSTALAGGVPTDLRNLQSGHRSVCWQNYADFVQRKQLYAFYEAFQM